MARCAVRPWASVVSRTSPVNVAIEAKATDSVGKLSMFASCRIAMCQIAMCILKVASYPNIEYIISIRRLVENLRETEALNHGLIQYFFCRGEAPI